MSKLNQECLTHDKLGQVWYFILRLMYFHTLIYKVIKSDPKDRSQSLFILSNFGTTLALCPLSIPVLDRAAYARLL